MGPGISTGILAAKAHLTETLIPKILNVGILRAGPHNTAIGFEKFTNCPWHVGFVYRLLGAVHVAILLDDVQASFLEPAIATIRDLLQLKSAHVLKAL